MNAIDRNTIDDYKNEMIIKYNDLVVKNECCRQLSEEIIAEYESDKYSVTIINCSQLVAYTDVGDVIKYSLYLLDGTKVYESSNTVEWDTWILDLSILGLDPGTDLEFQANSLVPKLTVKEIIRYAPNSSTAFYDVTQYENGYSYSVVPSGAKPPILKCSSLSIHNDSRMITRFTLQQDNNVIYRSSRVRLEKNLTINFKDLDLAPGIQISLKANCIGGSDSTAYMILEYDTTINRTAKYTLSGNAFKTVMIYNG